MSTVNILRSCQRQHVLQFCDSRANCQLWTVDCGLCLDHRADGKIYHFDASKFDLTISPTGVNTTPGCPVQSRNNGDSTDSRPQKKTFEENITLVTFATGS